MTLNFKPEEEEKFQPHNRWYNVHIKGFSRNSVFYLIIELTFFRYSTGSALALPQ